MITHSEKTDASGDNFPIEDESFALKISDRTRNAFQQLANTKARIGAENPKLLAIVEKQQAQRLRASGCQIKLPKPA